MGWLERIDEAPFTAALLVFGAMLVACEVWGALAGEVR